MIPDVPTSFLVKLFEISLNYKYYTYELLNLFSIHPKISLNFKFPGIPVNPKNETTSESKESPKGLQVWREAVAKSETAAQLAMCTYMLETAVAWDKSIMKAVSAPWIVLWGLCVCGSGGEVVGILTLFFYMLFCHVKD